MKDDASVSVGVNLNTGKADKELQRLEQKVLKLQEELTVGKKQKGRADGGAGAGTESACGASGTDKDRGRQGDHIARKCDEDLRHAGEDHICAGGD